MAQTNETRRVSNAAGPRDCSSHTGLNDPRNSKSAAFSQTLQRPRLIELRDALDARSSCLRRDECGDWALLGSFGHVFAVPEGFQFYVTTDERPRKWTFVKQRLSFCRVTQDGDDEGCLILDRLPSAQESELIRGALGIPKARHLSEERRAKLTAAGTLALRDFRQRANAQARFQAGFNAKSDADGQGPHENALALNSGNFGDKCPPLSEVARR
jgi:hypothetical protein